MEIGILNILDKKDISAERIVLQVREDCNSWAFILFYIFRSIPVHFPAAY